MTNVDFFRAFAADVSTKAEAYYFEHSREDFANLYDADSAADTQIKMFHYTDPRGINVVTNESGAVEDVEYNGEILMLIKSDIDEVIDGQKGQDYDQGKYEGRVKALIENGGLIAEILAYNNCNTNYEIEFSGLSEIYNMFDFNADGIHFRYKITIPA